jgi:hypothetical protein
MRTGSLQSLAIYEDCAGTVVAMSHDFGIVTQGNTYEWTMYVLNTGSEAMQITYLPSHYMENGGQSSFTINVNVIEYGVPCQMSPNVITPPAGHSLPEALPEKVPSQPNLGWPLMPTKMIKLDIILHADAVIVGANYVIMFEISGVAGLSSSQNDATILAGPSD